MQVTWINKINETKGYGLPFDTGKDVVVLGKGRFNRDRFLFNLTKVNLFFLNHMPPKWAIGFYRKNYPAIYEKSLFAFLHGKHIDDLVVVYKFNDIRVISWEGSNIAGIKTNNTSCACLDFLGHALNHQVVYICGFDMAKSHEWIFEIVDGQRVWKKTIRDFTQEVRYINKSIRKNAHLSYKFLTTSKLFLEVANPEQCVKLQNDLIQKGVILQRLTNQEIIENYKKASIKLPGDTGALIKKKRGKRGKKKCHSTSNTSTP